MVLYCMTRVLEQDEDIPPRGQELKNVEVWERLMFWFECKATTCNMFF
jgi:hypothetical protein